MAGHEFDGTSFAKHYHGMEIGGAVASRSFETARSAHVAEPATSAETQSAADGAPAARPASISRAERSLSHDRGPSLQPELTL
ncbi:hypothetical protein [Parvularcula marina]|uniref:Uncharacterized protein n=1 Tax=Parvularcula marina TaxID=2292771 RepID=A0A371RFR8_9PROT|nr:hypothetical protein [Parvularcula marina]RFB04286.1 hypothetical protein DX908_02685 [Parvularcula marina]